MTLYLDTSSLVKLYIQEEGTETVEELVNQLRVPTTSWLAYPEARAAFARKHRAGDLTDEEYGKVVEAFEKDWGNYLALEVSPHVLFEAGRLAERRALKAGDAIHLASALTIASMPPFSAVFFSSADGDLLTAAQVEGLHIHDSRDRP